MQSHVRSPNYNVQLECECIRTRMHRKTRNPNLETLMSNVHVLARECIAKPYATARAFTELQCVIRMRMHCKHRNPNLETPLSNVHVLNANALQNLMQSHVHAPNYNVYALERACIAKPASLTWKPHCQMCIL